MSIELEYLTDELCLIPGGVAEDRLGRLPILRRLAGVPDEARATHAASLIRTWLKQSILAVYEPVVFEDFKLDRDLQIHVFNLELGFEASGSDSTARRDRVMRLIGFACSTQTWRKKYERRLLHILAEHLYQITEGVPA